jgi:hypothetical protein
VMAIVFGSYTSIREIAKLYTYAPTSWSVYSAFYTMFVCKIPPSKIKPCMILPRVTKIISFCYGGGTYLLATGIPVCYEPNQNVFRMAAYLCTNKKCGWSLYERPLVRYSYLPGTSCWTGKHFNFHVVFNRNSNCCNNFSYL